MISSPPAIAPGDHEAYMRLALSQARKSPPKPTNFCVGAVLVDPKTNTILSTGYTLELEGNTHAEECAFAKLLKTHGLDTDNTHSGPSSRTLAEWRDVFGVQNAVLYTTMEPCSFRLSGNTPCVHRIKDFAGWVNKVYVGVSEPEIFVGENKGRQALQEAGIEVVHVPGMEDEILAVAKAGHDKGEEKH